MTTSPPSDSLDGDDATLDRALRVGLDDFDLPGEIGEDAQGGDHRHLLGRGGGGAGGERGGDQRDESEEG